MNNRKSHLQTYIYFCRVHNVFLLLFQVKPCIVQINLAICCVVPPDLQEYAKENDILLLTHNDTRGE